MFAFCCKAKWLSYTYIHILFTFFLFYFFLLKYSWFTCWFLLYSQVVQLYILHSYNLCILFYILLSQDIEYTSLCYTVGPFCLSGPVLCENRTVFLFIGLWMLSREMAVCGEGQASWRGSKAKAVCGEPSPLLELLLAIISSAGSGLVLFHSSSSNPDYLLGKRLKSPGSGLCRAR